MSNIVLAAGGDDGYQISRSVRLRSSATAYLNRTFAAAGNQQKMTFSMWTKRGGLLSKALYSSGWSGGGATQGGFNIAVPGDAIQIDQQTNNATDWMVKTTAVYRDPSAWYHIVIAIDTTQATAANRVIVYVNGVQVTSYATATYPSQNSNTKANATNQRLCSSDDAGNPYITYDGYLTETNFIDGQALTPSSFGETDAVTGVWKPKKYTGTYGTNGFYLNFSDNSAATAAAIGKDSSGNGNNWTPNNISVTAGVTYDSMLDVPTPYADGGNGRGNYCVLNPLNCRSGMVISSGNLQFQGGSAAEHICIGSMDIPAGTKIYYEMTVVTAAGSPNNSQVGIVPAGLSTSGYIGNSSGRGYGIEQNQTSDYRLRLNGADAIISNTPTSGDVLQVAVDMVNGKIWLGKNNTWYNSAGSATGDPSLGTNESAAISTTTVWQPAVEKYNTGGSYVINFGQRPFAYTPPTGFKALNTQNLPDATIKKGNQYFDATTYTGNGSGITVVNSGAFQPDFVWTKNRGAVADHALYDSLRTAMLSSNTTAAEVAASNVVSYNANGFSISGGDSRLNANTNTYVGWQWKESVTAGFDIVTYTGTGALQTINHSLGVAPKMILIKSRSQSANWTVYHASVGNTGALFLNLPNTTDTGSAYWNNTSPTSSVFTVNLGSASNTSGQTYVAYCFAEVAGYSSFGSFVGNGSSDGTFVYTGFRPRWIIIKRTTSLAAAWTIIDTSLSPYNVTDAGFLANSSGVQGTGAGYGATYDILSNGFKARAVVPNEENVSGATMIYAAFAENPFKNSLAR